MPVTDAHPSENLIDVQIYCEIALKYLKKKLKKCSILVHFFNNNGSTIIGSFVFGLSLYRLQVFFLRSKIPTQIVLFPGPERSRKIQCSSVWSPSIWIMPCNDFGSENFFRVCNRCFVANMNGSVHSGICMRTKLLQCIETSPAPTVQISNRDSSVDGKAGPISILWNFLSSKSLRKVRFIEHASAAPTPESFSISRAWS